MPALTQIAPSVIVPCGDTSQFPYESEMTIAVPPGADPVVVASGIIADEIADQWACGVCGEPPTQWSCQKAGTGPADPSDFEQTSPPELIGGVWYFYGNYEGGIDVSCRDC